MDCKACIAEDQGGYTVSWKLHAIDCGVYENGINDLRRKVEVEAPETVEYCPACHAEDEAGISAPWYQHDHSCLEYQFGLAVEQA